MNKNMKQNLKTRFYHQKLLAMSIAGLFTGVVSTSVTQASDIDIYQEAKSGDITLMMLLDISGSMKGVATARSDLGLTTTDCSGTGSGTTSPNYGYSRDYCTVTKSRYNTLFGGNATNKAKAAIIAEACNIQSNGDYHCGDRIARLKDAMYELLNGNTDKGVTKLDDDKIIGLATFGYSSNQTDYGAILVPARPLGCVSGKTGCGNISGASTQRQLITDKIKTMGGVTNTPTAFGYAEVINYMMGKRPSATNGFTLSDTSTKTTATGNSQTYITPPSLIQSTDLQKCSGQGIYVLTDGSPNKYLSNAGNMQTGLGNTNFACTTSSNWDCQHKAARELINKKNPLGLEIRTALVGFGNEFETVTSYDKTKTQQQNIDALGGCNATTGCTTDPKNAAFWGIIGGGGWYSGSSSKSVVDSVNSFLGDLGTDIPAVTTGSSTIPKDSLNPAVLQKQAYFPQFQPTPDKSYQLWAGNLKKYNVISGILKDKSGNKITDSTGRIVDNYDLWSKDVSIEQAIKDADENTSGSTKFALRGGAWSQLKLKIAAGEAIESRKLLTNRIASGTGTSAIFVTGSSLRRVTSGDLTDTTYQNDANRGYLMLLLGYGVDATKPDTITTTSLSSAPELRQIGAVMHSSPLLVTNKGKVTYTKGVIGSENREDYVLFGTTQGLLHVVDAKTGEEKFSFVPNEMIEKQKQAFQKYDTTTGGMANLYYGIDGPWTAYTEYVIDGSGNLTVGSGKGINQKGKQIVYGGLRMGGRSYYALDLQNINDPKLKFHISPDDKKVYSSDGTATTYNELDDMGESWSKPAITWVKWNNQRKRVMFVGGGYDAGGVKGDGLDASGNRIVNGGYESDTYEQANKKGGGVYMFDADNGKLLWWAGANTTAASTGVTKVPVSEMKYSVVSEIRTEDRDGDGLADHLYFGDLGGQLFRIDLDNKASSAASFAKVPRLLLNLHKASGTTGTSPRFYEMPAFSIYDYAGTTFAVVSIGSGNRSTPLKDYTVGTTGYDYDAVYNIYDKDVAARNLYNSGYSYATTTVTVADLDNGDLGEVKASNRNDNTTLVAPYAKKGWFYRFQSNKLQSAKVFATPIAINNRLFVSTFDGSKPGLSGDCGAGVKGESFLNQFCMPYGQCDKTVASGSGIACSTGDGCSLGAGIQYTAVVDDTADCDPTKQECSGGGGNGGPGPGDGKNNKNYCVSTGNRGAMTNNGVISAGSSKMCLIPQRWYERSR
jgi:type IV pilus assembly protein PilY1